MLGSYFSPLAPTAILLLSAFILPIITPMALARWQNLLGMRYFNAVSLVGLALLTLLGIRLTFGEDSAGQGLEILSAWNFSTPESVAALTVRADQLSLPFLIVVLLMLLAVTLLNNDSAADLNEQMQVTGWLTMGAGACLLFVSANGLTLIFATMAFDTFTALYWLGRGQRGWGVARLFLGISTAAGLILATLAPTNGLIPGIFLLGLALWLRLGLYPLSETIVQIHWRYDERLIYQGLSLSVGIYLAIRMISVPLPELIRWLVGTTMLLAGLLAWLADLRSPANDPAELPQPAIGSYNPRGWLLTWLVLAESLLILIVEPLKTGFAISLAVGLILSLAALWVTPALGKPHLNEGAWSWPYLPAVGATLTFIGLPLSLGWPARVSLYQSLLRADNPFFILIIFLAEGLALSGLMRYWLILGRGTESNSRRSVVGIVVLVPFLIPGLAPFLLSTLNETDLSLDSTPSLGVVTALIALVSTAVYLGYSRDQIIARLKIPVELLAQFARLNWLLRWWQRGLSGFGMLTLRVRVVLEGQHYLGWAIFTALIGALIILLS
jgi:hypothetical protein